jgi:hypothetical protein
VSFTFRCALIFVDTCCTHFTFRSHFNFSKTIALKASKKKVEASSEDDAEDEDEAVAMLAKNFRRLMKDDRFKKKFSDKMKKPLREVEPEEEEKRDPIGPRCFECSGFGHIWADCGKLKKGKGKAYNVTLSDELEEEAPESEFFLAFIAPHVEEKDSYYSEHRENEEELKEAYNPNDLNSLQTEKSSLLLKVQELKEKPLETQLQLERVTDEKLTRMLSIQKSPNDKTGLGYVASFSDVPSTSKTVFVKPTVPELPPAVEDKQKEKVNDDVPGIHQKTSYLPSLRSQWACSASVLPPESSKGQSQERSAQISSLWR